jgi:hypothetical protein
MGRPLQSGLALALARMHERHGDARLARRLLQLAAFLADRGPLGTLLKPRGTPPTIAFETGRTLDGHAAIRALLRALAAADTRREPEPAPRDGVSRVLRDELASWSQWLERIPIRHGDVPGALGLAIDRGRTVLVIGRGLALATDDELRFLVAHAAVGIAGGFAEMLAGDDGELAARLDALAVLANPSHEPTGERARSHAERWRERGPLEAIGAELRIAVLDELGHWLSRPSLLGQLRSELAHHWWLLATEASDELRGSLRALAHETGTMRGDRVDPLATLRTEAAQRLLGALGVYAASSASP